MGQLYASAVGTTVLQIREVPERPADLDGVLCIFGPGKGVGKEVEVGVVVELHAQLSPMEQPMGQVNNHTYSIVTRHFT